MNKTGIIIGAVLGAFLILLGYLAINTNPVTETIYTNTTITEYINTTTTEECICEDCEVCPYCPDAEYIRRVELSYNQCNEKVNLLNNTELKDFNYDLNISLYRCNEKIEELKEGIRNETCI